MKKLILCVALGLMTVTPASARLIGPVPQESNSQAAARFLLAMANWNYAKVPPKPESLATQLLRLANERYAEPEKLMD